MIAVSSTLNYELVVVDKPESLNLILVKIQNKFPSLMYDCLNQLIKVLLILIQF